MNKFILLSLLVFNVSPAVARWATQEDAPSNLRYTYVYNVNNDATFNMTMERESEVLKDKARVDEGFYRTTFTPSMEKLEVVRAETRNGKQVLPVDKKYIEIKPLASSGQGFDANLQLTIAFPDVKVGSKLYVKIKRTVFKPAYPGSFFFTWPIGWNENLKALKLEITSQIPLYSEVLDNNKHFKVTTTPKHLVFELEKPMYMMALEEENPIYDPNSLVWIGVSNLKTWSDFPKKTIAAYETTLSSPLPEKFKTILDAAKKKKDFVDQVNTVTSMLADSVRYVGDWRVVKGTYIPRSLKEVAATGYGDCKDFSSATGAILRKMGYDVHTAWIARGADWVLSPLKLAAPDINHAITYVKKDGQDIFIDATNTTSFAQTIFTDIADRPVVILHPDGMFERHTPAMQASDGDWVTNADMTIKDDGMIEAAGTIGFSGRGALTFTGMELTNSKAATDYNLMGWVTIPSNLLDWKVGPYDLRSRTVEHFDTKFEYRERWRPVSSTAGEGYMVPPIGWLNYFRFKREGRASNVNVGYPLKTSRNITIVGKKVLLSKEVKCQGDSPWADFARRIYLDKGTLRIADKIDFKKKQITAAETSSKEFAEFQENILHCMQEALIVFK